MLGFVLKSFLDLLESKAKCLLVDSISDKYNASKLRSLRHEVVDVAVMLSKGDITCCSANSIPSLRSGQALPAHASRATVRRCRRPAPRRY